MPDEASMRDLVIGLSPIGQPDARLVAALHRAGALAVLDLGTGDRWARQALAQAAEWTPAAFGVRIGAACQLRPDEVEAIAPGRIGTVLLGPGAPWQPDALLARYRVLVEVTDLAAARAAATAGAHGLIARGWEAGGQVGELSSYVLLQQLLGAPDVDLPVWIAGGIGPGTAAASVLGGAAGVLLDTQLALLAESDLPAGSAATLRAADGSETVVIDGCRVLPAKGGSGTDLPVGQDAFLAGTFAQRYRDTATAVQAVRAAILAAVDDGDAAGALLPGAPLAAALGIGLPVAQGPMTRVSDQPAFAAAVADAGGLPFLALALSTGEQTRTLLEQTRAALGDRPWGVGVLGFAPEEIRSAQLAAIAAVRPAAVILAGGRPSQAGTLEELGIPTFLHVPSPGLLGQFLRAGARRFVFEGAECGGHVGPRASFPLWEAQLGVLEEHLAAAEPGGEPIQVLFAGGVHDARSAAMVAVLAGPLRARGVQVGVLMGTAYLCTEEAVRCGAIRPAFQRQVLAAERTDLLRTAPGHATRGVASPFTAGFQARRAELEAAGVPPREIWEQLEQLNIGRLRVASKGLRREGDRLVEVDDAGQVTDGLFMAGQVAVLRSTVSTVAELHESVTAGAAALHADRVTALRAAHAEPLAAHAARAVGGARDRGPDPLDIAIIGMSCFFPGSPDLASYWATVLRGTDAVTEVPADRWDPGTYYSADATGAGAGHRTPSKWGGFLPPIPFDPLRYGIPPAALRAIEPSQLLALEAARQALADAGCLDPAVDHSRTGVVFGAEAGSDLSNAGVLRAVLPAYLGQLPAELAEQLPVLTEDSFPGLLANVIAGRIANRLDLGGVNYTVDAACASSLAALDAACGHLVAGSTDLMVCGGVDLHNGINDYLLFSSVHALSPTGRSRTFDAAADGIALGEGVGCVVLKRLADAERDGDRIYAVIKGVGAASDGRALGLTAPRPEGQRRALDRAYRNAGVSPAEVGLVEAHGTGTVVGDRTELTTLTELFTDSGARPGSCVLGSVKSQIGHTKCAAGLAGLIKAALALHTAVRPPTIHLERPNAAWDPERSPFAFLAAPLPWPAPPARRIAGVSAFGFGGTNFHAVLRAHDGGVPPRHGYHDWPAELFAFRGTDRAAAYRAVDGLLELTAANDAAGRPWRLRDLAATAGRRFDARAEPVRVAVVAADLDELGTLLRRARAGEHDPAAGLFQPPDSEVPADPPTVAFLFPGQGSQRPGMLSELFVAFPELRRYLDLGQRWVDRLYPPAAFEPDRALAQDLRVRDTRVAQPVLGIAGLAVDHLLGRLGVRPHLVAGHSYGELVALAAAGALDPATLLALSEARAGAIADSVGADPGADPGTMAAVSAPLDEVARVLAAADLTGRVVPANQNAPRQTVVSGPTALVDDAVAALRAAGFGAKRIPVACAFHSPLVATAGPAFAAVLADHPVRAPEVPVWANRTAARYGPEPADVRAELAAQLGAPVRFADQIEAMYAAGARVFVEAGPGRVLSGLVSAILGDRPHTAVPCDGGGLRGLLVAVARLATAGVPVRTGWLFDGRDAHDVGGTTPPTRPGWTVDGHLVRTSDGRPVPGGLTPARPVLEATLSTSPAPTAQPAGHDRDALLADFLRTNRELVAAQRDVLLAYLSGPAGVPTAAPAAAPALVAAPTAASLVAAAPLPAATALAPAEPEATEPGAASSDGPPDIAGMVFGIIAERTGYPVDMIEPDADLEADLSIDSIKRTEIAGELAARLGGAASGASLSDAELEELARARTARAISDWLAGRLATAAERTPAPAAPEPQAPAPAAPVLEPSAPVAAAAGVPPKRLLSVRTAAEPAAASPPATLAGLRFTVLGGPDAAVDAVRTLLAEHGAAVRIGRPGEPADGVIHLGALAPGEEGLLPLAFEGFQAALRHAPRWLVAAYPADRATGLAGLFRCVEREYPAVIARAIEVDPDVDPAELAGYLLAELCVDDRTPVVGRSGSRRYRYELADTPLGALARGGAGPAGDGTAEAEAIGLDRDSVVVLFGGARGITAQFARTLASASRCRIELVGRTQLALEPEPADLVRARDRPALRAALVGRGLRSPAEIERTVEEVLAQREVNDTLAELRTRGARPRYHAVDIRSADAVYQLLKQVHADHGRVDGVVHAAGVLADRLLAEQDAAGFERVFATKVDGAGAILTALDGLALAPRFTVFFGSIAAVLGNRGQGNYAAANDALEAVGRFWAARTGHRCLTVHWGPWAPSEGHGGMVTPELAREYGRRGIALIDPEEGALSLLRELAWGEERTPAVVYTASGW